ncbi:hypothetical protein AUEXF2481DRAFT_41076 [Aureobasidium subglaciale EXF-2481]|uniref:vWA found in TerF C terminus domain-containing protein n=1 Tax=Aureobasidium subglaciale (strain EXF-2481) TaxID=1043005 RepID=A0A074Y9N8_AURSE|nr:uncharacterized protein AUEXF2481DRAFT_41076 [Aureobasidium subglaciale EXF-2481]KAI5209797.1 hypothetical protein E4T38_02367 [Aureobasidium subglaciale]KAI5228468.1 hypothetical protein E4T40_02146 [Aureobasidium subglaciale]KAI5232025.1 hypothetical protein E4T41_02366 [Aureobasidium subglaciale]KAI5265834.1 hypothetical protein E4T46_02144 [Aureobasidium subglaciale]KEQ94485.1 hypothetical protein AUEXF2481DRAFT_41076 [Aureobasidium subglaciale EXF-2481]
MSGYQAYPGASGYGAPPPPPQRPFANSPFQSQPPQQGQQNPGGYSSPAPYGQSQQTPYPSQQYPQSAQQPYSTAPSQGYNRPPPPPPPGQQSQYGQSQGYPPQSPAPFGQSQGQTPFGQSQPPSHGQSQPPYGLSQQPSYGQPQQPYGQSQPAYGSQQQQYGGGPPGYGQPPQQQQGGYGAPPQQQGGYPPQPQQGGYPGQQPGAPQGGQGGYGAPPSQPAGPAEIQAYKQSLQQTIQEKRLQAFYPPGSPIIDQIAQKASAQVDRLCQQWRINKEIGNDIVKLALYDVVLYIDDSGSMKFEENGERIKDLQLILERVATAATLFDDDGISVRFMNDNPPQHMVEHIKTEQQIQQLVAGHKFSGLTPMGTELRKKVVEGIVVPAIRSRQMRKPILVITITDGQPAGEPTTAVFDTVRYAIQEASNSQYGPGAIAFQFAQVGNDEKAREFLGKLDDDPTVGQLVDCTSNFENESAEMARANPPVDLTPDLWILKLILGAIDPSYDTKDEKSNHPPGGAPGYGAPPPQQGGYGGQQQFAPPGGAPPGYGQQQQGGYGQQQGGYPPQQQGGYGQQQGGYPPQQGGYGGQQQGYGAPPQPPRY